MDSSIPPPAPGWPSRKSRRRVGLFVGGFVALQLLIPLTSLLAGDPRDGRFTWRDWPTPTESSQTPSCELRASREHRDGTEETVELQRLVHEDWLTRAVHNESVREALLRKQCEPEGVIVARLVQHCIPDEAPQDFRLRCGGGHMQDVPRTASR